MESTVFHGFEYIFEIFPTLIRAKNLCFVMFESLGAKLGRSNAQKVQVYTYLWYFILFWWSSSVGFAYFFKYYWQINISVALKIDPLRNDMFSFSEYTRTICFKLLRARTFLVRFGSSWRTAVYFVTCQDVVDMFGMTTIFLSSWGLFLANCQIIRDLFM